MALTTVNHTVLNTPDVTVVLANDTTPGGVGTSIATVAGAASAASSAASTAQGTANSADTRSKIYDIASGTVGKPAAGATILRFVAPRTFYFAAGLPGSVVRANTTAAGNATFIIKKNGSTIGTMAWTTGNSWGTFSFGATVYFVAGDILTIDAPNPADSNLSDLFYTISGTLS